MLGALEIIHISKDFMNKPLSEYPSFQTHIRQDFLTSVFIIVHGKHLNSEGQDSTAGEVYVLCTYDDTCWQPH